MMSWKAKADEVFEILKDQDPDLQGSKLRQLQELELLPESTLAGVYLRLAFHNDDRGVRHPDL